MWARAGWVRAGSRAGECRVGEGGAQRGVGVVLVGVEARRRWRTFSSNAACVA